MSARRVIEQMTSPEFAAAAAAPGATVILPFGTVEAHGGHLPLGTDTLQVEAVCVRAAELTGALLAPAVPYGVCLSTRDHPGTVGIASGTLQALLADLVRSFRRQGIRRVVIVSGHAGRTHVQALRDAAEQLIDGDRDLRVALVSEYDLVREEGADLLRTAEDFHAGEIETSRVLFLSPELVRGTSPAESPSFDPYLLSADKVSRWPGSVWGDPEAADAGLGQRLMERSVSALCRIIAAVRGE